METDPRIIMKMYPVEIKDKEVEVMEFDQMISSIKKQISLHKHNLMCAIYEFADEEGKRVYSNELKRTNEFEKRIQTDMVYIQQHTKLNDLEYKRNKILIEVGFLKRRFIAAEVLLRCGDGNL